MVIFIFWLFVRMYNSIFAFEDKFFVHLCPLEPVAEVICCLLGFPQFMKNRFQWAKVKHWVNQLRQKIIETPFIESRNFCNEAR